MQYPKRTADTMSDAIALSSPNGRISKRAKEAACNRLSLALFGPNGLQREPTPQPTEEQNIRNQIQRLQGLVDRGMNVRKFQREIYKLKQFLPA